MRWTLMAMLAGGPAFAQDIEATARALYPAMPGVDVVARIAGNCGATEAVNPRVAYCTTRNRIYVAEAALADPSIAYELAHQFGHAIFVQHGVADVALRAIRANRAQEAFLRGQVARQIDCLAGVILSKGGFDFVPLDQLFDAEPFTGAHWGRDPLRVGPVVSVGIDVRSTWVARGYEAAHPSSCAVPELPIALLLDPYLG